MNAKKIKGEVERAFREVREELDQNELLSKIKPFWIVVGGVALLAWVLSGAPMVVASLSASFTIFIVLGAVLFGPPLWVYSDARNRHVKHPLGWGVFSLFTPPVGALIYYLLRPDSSKLKSCTSCQSVVNSSFQACPYCGTGLASQRYECPSCECEVRPDWRFCPYCRVKMENVAAAGDSAESSSQSART